MVHPNPSPLRQSTHRPRAKSVGTVRHLTRSPSLRVARRLPSGANDTGPAHPALPTRPCPTRGVIAGFAPAAPSSPEGFTGHPDRLSGRDLALGLRQGRCLPSEQLRVSSSAPPDPQPTKAAPLGQHAHGGHDTCQGDVPDSRIVPTQPDGQFLWRRAESNRLPRNVRDGILRA